MFLPRILSKNAFAIAGLGVRVCPDEWTAPPSYEALVQAAWKDLLAQTRHRIWDGTYYRVLNPAELEKGTKGVTLRLGTIRYRYVATFSTLHQQHADQQLEALNHLSTVALIRTSDEYYLFGRRARNGVVDLIGGGVQGDELPVASGADLEQNLYKEMREEVGISRDDISELSGIGILCSGTSNVIIVGHAQARLSKAEATAQFEHRTEDEIAKPVFTTAAGLRGFLREMSDYRRLIPDLL